MTTDLCTARRELKAALTAQIMERARELAECLIEVDDLPLRLLGEAWRRAGLRDPRVERLLASPLDNDAIADYLGIVERAQAHQKVTR